MQLGPTESDPLIGSRVRVTLTTMEVVEGDLYALDTTADTIVLSSCLLCRSTPCPNREQRSLSHP